MNRDEEAEESESIPLIMPLRYFLHQIPKTARLTIFFDRFKDPNNEQYFLIMGDVHVRYRWRQGYAK